MQYGRKTGFNRTTNHQGMRTKLALMAVVSPDSCTAPPAFDEHLGCCHDRAIRPFLLPRLAVCSFPSYNTPPCGVGMKRRMCVAIACSVLLMSVPGYAVAQQGEHCPIKTPDGQDSYLLYKHMCFPSTRFDVLIPLYYDQLSWDKYLYIQRHPELLEGPPPVPAIPAAPPFTALLFTVPPLTVSHFTVPPPSLPQTAPPRPIPAPSPSPTPSDSPFGTLPPELLKELSKPLTQGALSPSRMLDDSWPYLPYPFAGYPYPYPFGPIPFSHHQGPNPDGAGGYGYGYYGY